MNGLQKFAKNVLLSIDQFGNVLLLGDADETISARCYREGVVNGKTGWKYFGKFVDTLFWFEPAHTMQAFQAEQDRCHMPMDYQKDGASCAIDVVLPSVIEKDSQ